MCALWQASRLSYRTITSIQTRTGVLKGKLTVTATSRTAEIDGVSNGELLKFAAITGQMSNVGSKPSTAKAVDPTQGETPRRRGVLTDEVKQYVWRRDEGKCVLCGSRDRLEYDHIIPYSMGGSDTARNVQLLCERCNRSKGGQL